MSHSSTFQLLVPSEVWGEKTVSRQYPTDSRHRISVSIPALINVNEGVFSIQTFMGMDYLIEMWSFNVNRKGTVILRTQSSFAAMLICLKGNFTDNTDQQHTITTRSYTLCYYPKGDHILEISEGELIAIWVTLPLYYLHSMAIEHGGIKEIFNAYQFGEADKIFFVDLPLTPSVIRVIRRFEESREQAASLDHSVRSYVLELLSLYNKHLRTITRAEAPIVAQKEKRIHAILSYINGHLTDDVIGNTAKLATIFLISPTALRKEFKQVTGVSIQHYIRDERLRHAKKMLEETNTTMFEVALLIGYSSTGNFVRAFKRLFGHPPTGHK